MPASAQSTRKSWDETPKLWSWILYFKSSRYSLQTSEYSPGNIHEAHEALRRWVSGNWWKKLASMIRGWGFTGVRDDFDTCYHHFIIYNHPTGISYPAWSIRFWGPRRNRSHSSATRRGWKQTFSQKASIASMKILWKFHQKLKNHQNPRITGQFSRERKQFLACRKRGTEIASAPQICGITGFMVWWRDCENPVGNTNGFLD